jgi:hypothetical protein
MLAMWARNPSSGSASRVELSVAFFESRFDRPAAAHIASDNSQTGRIATDDFVSLIDID